MAWLRGLVNRGNKKVMLLSYYVNSEGVIIPLSVFYN